MPLPVWLALGFLVVVAVAGSIVVVLRGLRAWRAFRSLRRSLADALDGFVRKAAGVESRVAAAAGTAAKLDEATARLRSSLATASVLSAAAGEVRTSVGRVRGVVPRK